MTERGVYLRQRSDGQHVLTPTAGGVDQIFNTRPRTMVIGETKPTAALTGTFAGDAAQLEPRAGLTNTTPGQFEFYEFRGRFINQAEGLTDLSRCAIHLDVVPSGATGVVTNQRENCLLGLYDCDIYATVSSPLITGILGGNIYAERCRIWNVVDMCQIYCTVGTGYTDGPTGTTIRGCYGHDLLYYSPDAAHADTDNNTHNDFMQLLGGSGLLMEGCFADMTEGPLSFYDPATGHASGGFIGQGATVTPVRAAARDFTIRNNWFNHGIRGFIAEGAASGETITGGHVTGNRFGRDIITTPASFYGPMVARTTFGIEYAANVYEDDGSPVPIYYRS